MPKRTFRTVALAVACGLLAAMLANPASAEITKEQQAQAKDIQAKLLDAGRAAIRKKLDEAEKLATEAQTSFVQLASSGEGQDFKRMIETLEGRLNITRRSLSRRGVKLPDLPKPGDKPTTPAGTDGVSFTKDVAPILVGRCRGCHINNNRGMFSMSTFRALSQGVGGAPVVSPGDGRRSRLVEILRDGDMPPGNARLPNEQIDTISKWIDEGAKFDGESPTGSIAANLPGANQPRERLEVVEATGKESILFSRDIAPVLAETCVNCHGGNRPQGRLGLDSFQRLLRGGDTGTIVAPGKPADSLLVKKLKGEADGMQMPARQPPLSADVIAKFEKWIAEGAKFDGPDPAMSTTRVARIYAVTQMSHDELAQERVKVAQGNWRLANPDDQPTTAETENFLLMGNVSEDELKKIGNVAEEQQSKVLTMLRAPKADKFVKGRVTLYAFRRRFDYSEYGQMVENRSIPSNWRGHFMYDVIDAYACLYPPEFEEDEGSLEVLVGEQLAGAYLSTLGEVPDWFTQGAAWTVAGRLDPKDPRVISRNEKVGGALGQMKASDDFLKGNTSPEAAMVLNHSYVKFLMTNKTRFGALLTEISKGAKFDAAFKKAYGDHKEVTLAWAKSTARKL